MNDMEQPLNNKNDKKVPQVFSWQDMELDPFYDSGNTFEWQEPEKADRWAISWSDLMMTMFILFVVLYVYKVGNRELKFGPNPGDNYISDKGSSRIVDMDVRKQPSDIYNQTKAAIKDKFMDNTVQVDLVADRAVRIVLAGDLFFDLGQAELRPEAQWRLRQIAKILHENSFVINVIGHTDDMPNHSESFPTNWELSTARACSVVRYLVNNQDVEESRFFVSGHSWLRPLVPNTTSHNRSLNRRVEIILMKELPYSRVSAKISDQIR